MHTLRVSIIIPCYNMAHYLLEAIQSALDQTYPVHEILVVDDGSQDNSAEVAASFQAVRVIHQVHANLSVARNTGVAHASGNLISFLDADDVWMPEKTALQVDVLQKEPSCSAVFCMVQNFISPELDHEQRDGLHCPPEPMLGISATAMTIRREAFEQVGPFEPKLMTSQFIEWWTRFNDAGLKYQVLPMPLVRRRIHLSNTTRQQREVVHQNYLKIARLAIQRRKNR